MSENLQGIFCPWCGCDKMDVVNRTLVCTCSKCERPMAASEVLAQAEQVHHVVTIGRRGFSIQHPLIERLDERIASCDLHRTLLSSGRPPGPPGKYIAHAINNGWAMIGEDALEELRKDFKDGLREEVMSMMASDSEHWSKIGGILMEMIDEEEGLEDA